MKAPLACLSVLGALLVVGAGRADDPFNAANRQVYPTAQRIDFKTEVTPKEAKPGEVVHLTITATPRPGFHTYPLTERTTKQREVTNLYYLDTTIFKPLYPIAETAPKLVDYGTVVGKLLEHDKPFTWQQDFLVVNPEPKPDEFRTGTKFISLGIYLQVCDTSCVVGWQFLDVPIIVESTPMPTTPPDLTEKLKRTPRWVVDPATGERTPDKEETPPPFALGNNPNAAKDLPTFLGLAVLWGALSLVTPCVFPMIPITVSFFLKQSETKNRSPLLLALVYSGTITAVLTIGGIFLIQILQPFSQHFLTNFFLGALFLVFALSLFGMYEIALPSRLINFTSAGEGRGGVVGTIFMALTFSIISFTCVAPFYGGFIGLMSSSQNVAWWSNTDVLLKLCLGAFVYSATFASPFFLLALFPSLMRALPRSGSWMNTVKVVMGFLELAAAFKLLRAAELGLTGKAEYLTYDLVLGIYVALAFALGLYLLNLYRLPHDHGTPEAVGVPRLLLAVAVLSGGLYLLPGLFKQGEGERQRPRGEVFSWMESFLLPDDEGTALGNLDMALRKADSEGKLVFIDFTGELCTNCSYNENSVFTRPQIRGLLKQYVMVKLYCDSVPPEYQPTTSASENQRFRDDEYKNAQLPLYVIIKPTGDGKFQTLGVYDEGKINFPDRFAEFLKKPLAK